VPVPISTDKPTVADDTSGEAPAREARTPAKPAVPRGSHHTAEREGRQLALAAIFEADFGQRTATTALERRLGEGDIVDRAAVQARRVVAAVTQYRDSIDARIEAVAPAYPVVQLARIDRALLRCGMGELLHCPTTPARVAISEWVELARTYSGEPARRLMNGALGRVAKDVTEAHGAEAPTGPRDDIETGTRAQMEGPGE
jgi:N utilization substance protein B